jgi:hypothetical protein
MWGFWHMKARKFEARVLGQPEPDHKRMKAMRRSCFGMFPGVGQSDNHLAKSIPSDYIEFVGNRVPMK